uniref:Reverse transcriptase zinc-binding domain-containing protein n=1 Tax=Medicago truncatula TaxID=3880 RepID=A2Q564_MEDTR|nr:hypothetical protein MtrDRAFT_AC160012g33v2 [Medicago truncatula]
MHDSPDVWVWTNRTSGIYSIQEGYQWLMGAHTSLLGEESWNWIWHLCVPSNIRFFLWQLCHDSVPFRSVLLSRNVCSICNQGSEDMLHALYPCPRAKDVLGKERKTKQCHRVKEGLKLQDSLSL